MRVDGAPVAAQLSEVEVARRLATIDAERLGRAGKRDDFGRYGAALVERERVDGERERLSEGWDGCDEDERVRRLAAMRSLFRAPPTATTLRLGLDQTRTRHGGGVVTRIGEGESGPTLGDLSDEDFGKAVAASADFELPKAAPSFSRWPATLHPDFAERCYYNAREASRRWVGDLRTRGGAPRWDRIRRCGDPVALLRVGDGAIAWEHRWCRDRACYSCARSRSRRLATELRTSVESRPDARRLYFVTLTQPRFPGESCSRAWDRSMRAWTALRHHPAFRELLGGVRVTEVTYSQGHERATRKIPGWHVHMHLVVELREAPCNERCPACSGTRKRVDASGRARGERCRTCGSRVTMPSGVMPDAIVAMLSAWRKFSGGVPQAQCAVPLDSSNVGQLAKYLTKLWNMPDSHARELFDAATGRRTIDGFGAWRAWRRFGADVEKTPRGWISCGIPLRALESLSASERVDFTLPLGVTMEAEGRERWRPHVAVATATVGSVLAALRKDPRPVWSRDGEQPPETAAALASINAALRVLRRECHRGGLGPPGCATLPAWPQQSSKHSPSPFSEPGS